MKIVISSYYANIIIWLEINNATYCTVTQLYIVPDIIDLINCLQNFNLQIKDCEDYSSDFPSEVVDGYRMYS